MKQKKANWRLLPVGLAFMMACMPGWGDEPSPYSLGAVETVTHDSNVFRSPDGGPISADWQSTTGLIGSFDQPIGRQRLKARGEFDINRFHNNTQLNSSAHNLSIEGDWSTVDRLSGELGYSSLSQLYRYSLDSRQTLTERNTQQVNQAFARVHLGVVTAWTFDAIWNGLDLGYSAEPYRPRDLRRWDGQLGARYQSSPDLGISLALRHTRGEYPHYALVQQGVSSPDEFSRNDVIFGLVYMPSGASTLKLNVSTAREQHSMITSRSFRTWAADGQWLWKPTGRTQFVFDFVRDNDTGSTDNPFFVGSLSSTDARMRTAFSGTLSYSLTAKIKVRATGSIDHRSLDTAFADIPQLDVRGHDRLISVGLGFDYDVTRSVQLGCKGSRERRTVSGDALSITYPYSATVVSCSGQFAFN